MGLWSLFFGPSDVELRGRMAALETELARVKLAETSRAIVERRAVVREPVVSTNELVVLLDGDGDM